MRAARPIARHRTTVMVVLVAVCSLTCIAPAHAAPPETPGWYAAELRNYADSFGRLRDQLSNPQYWPLRLSQADTDNADPYRAPELWAPERGRVLAVRYPNRYGAMISAHLWAPRRATRGASPAVIFINGAGDAEEDYWSFAQDLAEHGYVVMTFDPQGLGKSDDDPYPAQTYCDPNGSWREPQEMGVREHGKCAGQNDNGVNSTVGQVPGVVEIVIGGHTGREGTVEIQGLYELLSPNYIFGAFDAYGWMASRDNPWRREIDFNRVGVMGHSLGAYAAAMVANGDPLHRFRVGVSLDSYAYLQHGVRPRVPTLYEQSEQELFSGPRLAAPPPTALHGTRVDYDAFVRRRVDTMYVVLRASNHYEFGYVGPEQRQPASRLGQRVATYFAVAWLDRRFNHASSRRGADSRLLAARFDTSVDRSSIGLGTWDPTTMTNQPYMIGGMDIPAALSSYYVSRYAFAGRTCEDMRSSCG